MDATIRTQYDNLFAQDGAVRYEALTFMPQATDQLELNKKGSNQMNEEQLQRVRTICLALPGTSERLSHGEPTFFIGKKVFTMFANNHHNDGHIAVWIPVPEGAQAGLIDASPQKFFRPPYVGGRGWVGIELAEIDTEELTHHVRTAWKLIAPKKLRSELVAP